MSAGLWFSLVRSRRPSLEVRTIAHPILTAILAEDPTGYALWH